MKVWFLLISILLSIGRSDVTIAIIGTNDIHGKAFPTILSTRDSQEKYNYGGLVYLSRLIEIIQQENPGRTIYLDAGDQFQGGIESSKLISSGEIMNDFYNILNLQGSSMGNHEFDFGPDFLFPYMIRKNSQSLAANLRSEKGEINFLPSQKSSMLFQFENGIKVGVIGLSTLETPKTTSGFSGGKFPPYRFLDYKNIVETESKKLKLSGANAILIVSHVGDACPIDLTYANRTKSTVQPDCPIDQITELITSLPEGTVHGVVQGHRHKMAHHYKRGIPYMGTINGGYYFNVMYLTFNTNNILIDTMIEGPIPVCDKIFKNLGRCNYLSAEEAKIAGDLVNWKFHGKDVYAYEPIDTLFKAKWLPMMKPYFEQIVNNEVELYKVETRECEVANLFTNLIHEAYKEADFVLLNPGGFRTEWVPGVIQYQHYYNMFPFENNLESFEITGQELLKTLSIIQSGKKGFYQCWNLQMVVTFDGVNKGFVSAKFMNGSAIQPTATYRGITIDFLLDGGDDFDQIINKIYTPRNVFVVGDFKEILKPFLMDLKTIKEGSLIDPENPRLIVQ